MEGGGEEEGTKRWLLREMEEWKDGWRDGWKEGRVEGLMERGVRWAGSPYPTVCQGSQGSEGIFICPVSLPKSPAEEIQ